MLISSIRGHFGYGGIIHKFKNFFGGGAGTRFIWTERQIRSDQFIRVTTQYLAVTTAPAEHATILAVRGAKGAIDPLSGRRSPHPSRPKGLRGRIHAKKTCSDVFIFDRECDHATGCDHDSAHGRECRRRRIGQRMFYDARLSDDTSLRCASCHQPGIAFTDGEALSQAYSGTGHFRNASTLANVGYRDAWMHDGRLRTNLNDVAREMITETYLMNVDAEVSGCQV